MSNHWDPIDTMHLGYDRVLAIYLVETADGLALIDSGPATTLPAVEAALADGPKYFEELMAAAGSRDGREIVRELEQLRTSRGLQRDGEGRYAFK